MFTPAASTLTLAILLSSVSAHIDAAITPAVHLVPRANDPAFVGYISENGGYSNPRTCDYPQTVSTSGAYVQCCPTTGACPFYTSCSGNTLFAAGATVPCDATSTLSCNTGIVLSTPGANGGGSYLACWQTALGSSPFTIVQNIGSATSTGSGSVSASSTVAASSGITNTAASASASASSASRTSSSAASSSVTSAASSAAASASKNVGNHVIGEMGLGDGIVGGVAAVLLQALI